MERHERFMAFRVSCIGSGTIQPDSAAYALACAAGRAVAEAGWVVVCGGLAGTMEAVCRGAKEAGGTTVGVLPGEDPRAANPWVDTAVATGLGPMRNYLVVLNGDAVLAFHGGAGTRSELALAQKVGKEVVSLGRFSADETVRQARDVAHAVALLQKLQADCVS